MKRALIEDRPVWEVSFWLTKPAGTKPSSFRPLREAGFNILRAEPEPDPEYFLVQPPVGWSMKAEAWDVMITDDRGVLRFIDHTGLGQDRRLEIVKPSKNES